MTTKTAPYNPFDHLLTDSEVGDYLIDALYDDDPRVFVTALGHAIKKQGVAEITDKTGLNRENLYKIISGKTQPQWATIQRLIKALNIRFRAFA